MDRALEAPARLNSPTPQSSDSIAAHLTPLYGKDWAVWNSICLRGAGFPSHLVQSLSTPSCVSALQRLLHAERAVVAAIGKAGDAVRQELTETSETSKRRQLHRLLRPLAKGKLPAQVVELPPGFEVEIRRGRELEEEALILFNKEFAAERYRISRTIRNLAKDELFQRAVLLQNAQALRHVRSGLQAVPSEQLRLGFKGRQDEELIASYLQRYCVKNDTIGFFGPVGWAQFARHGESVRACPGPNLVDRSEVFFEHWCVEALAEEIARVEGVRAWIAPRCSPYVYVNDSTVYLPGGSRRRLSPAFATVLNRCDGERTAHQISLEVVADSGTGIHTESEVYSILQELTDRHIVSWKIQLPLELYPERRLRRLLQRIEPDELRLPALDALSALESAREQVASAVNDAHRLETALEELDTTFVRLTHKTSVRSGGQMYAGRTLVFSACRRDFKLEIGPEILHVLGDPLSLILTTARWFTYRTAVLYRKAFDKVYQDLTRKTGTAAVSAFEFWMRVQDSVLDPETRLFNGVISEMQAGWQNILNVPWGERRAEYSSNDLRPHVEELFSAPGPGWMTARHHSPDVFIAAADPEAIRTGDYFLVLGEFHLAVNSLRGTLVSQHPCPEELARAITLDLPGTYIFPTAPRSWPGWTTLNSVVLSPTNHYQVEISPEAVSSAPRSRTLPISALVVEDSGHGLVVRTRDGNLSVSVIEFLGEVLSTQLVNSMKLLPANPHSPRITIDRLVVSRESWYVSAEDISFAHEHDDRARYYAGRKWAEALSLPRYVFVKTDIEDKPMYVDFDSPIYVELFGKAIRRVLASEHPRANIVISEMLPAHGQNWLSDSAGQKYTSELRIIACDQRLPSSAAPWD